MGSIKCICWALVCLGVLGGLIDCSPFSPMDMVPERVLVKPPHSKADHDKATHDILQLPSDVMQKLGEMIIGMIPPSSSGHKQHESLEMHEIEGLEKHLAHMEKLNPAGYKDISSKIPIEGVSHLHVEALLPEEENFGDLTKQTENEELVKPETKSEDAESISRKRRHTITPATKVVNKKPYVEARYEIEDTPHPHAAKSRFVQENNDFIVSDPQGLEENSRPIIIYVNNCKNIHLESDNGEHEHLE